MSDATFWGFVMVVLLAIGFVVALGLDWLWTAATGPRR